MGYLMKAKSPRRPRLIFTRSLFCVLLLFPALVNAQITEKPYNKVPELHDLLRKNRMQALQHSRNAAQRFASSAEYGYDVTFYDLDLKLIPSQSRLEGTVKIRAMVPQNAPAPLTEVKLDLYSNMSVLSAGGDASGFSHAFNELRVAIPEKAPGESFQITITYQGRPVQDGFAAYTTRLRQGNWEVFTLSEPYFARAWWPCKDVPSDKADSARIRLTVPEDMIAVSNGKLLRTSSESGWTTYDWYEYYPITAYLISIAATNYRIYQDWYVNGQGDSLSLPSYIYPERYDESLPGMLLTPDMMDAFEFFFGPYPFWGEKYAQAHFGWGGGMEHQTATSLCCFNELLMAHELAHQWWGDKVTCRDWRHIWLNEGFASYAEVLWKEFRYGEEAARGHLQSMAAEPFYGRIFVDDTTDVGAIFARIVYRKGAWVLHMLRSMVGDAVFFDILRTYEETPPFKYGTAVTEDFQRVAEQISGLDLAQFFRQWIYSPGRPRYLYGWQTQKNGSSYTLQLSIKQDQADTTTFAMTIPFLVRYFNGSERITVENSRRCENYTLDLPDQPQALVFDPDATILQTNSEIPYTSIASDCSLVPITFALAPTTPNPLSSRSNGADITLRYSLDVSAKAVIRVYNTLGQEVVMILEQHQLPGQYAVTWGTRDTHGKLVPSGIYFVTLQAAGKLARQKLVVVR